MMYGVGQVVGSFMIGQLIDKTNPKKATFLNFVIIALTMIISILCIEFPVNISQIFLMALLWGLQEGINIVHLLQTVASEFLDF